MSTRYLSELEGAVLGLLWTTPTTPYQIRRVLQRSPNPSWSGSTGAIYPLFRRLQRRGLLSARHVRQGRRAATQYSLTYAGKMALQRWVAPPLADIVVGVPMDALRTRLRFLAVLSAEDRRAFVVDAIAKLRAQIAIVRADCRNRRASGDVYSYLTARGALHSCRARLAWLLESQRLIEKQLSSVSR